jgi:CRISPR-associated protein Cas2
MQDARWYLVCYDVRDPKRLRHAARLLEGYGQRMQYSIFRVWLSTPQMEKLRWELTELLEPEDDVMLIPLTSQCVRAIKITHQDIKEINWPTEPPSHRII